jgi:IclR family transcriptional regulator, acetate operon repressor
MVVSSAGGRNALSGTLERGLAILEFFAATREATAGAVAESLGLSRSATYRIVETLRYLGYLEVNPATERLRLGMRAAELGMAALSGIDVVRLAPAYLQGLVENTSETSFLAVVDDDAVVYVYKEEGPQPVTMSSQLGSRRPMHCTALGKAYMSALPDEPRRALISRLDLRRYTANTITDAEALERELAGISRRGYAVDNVEVEEGVACYAAPVLDHRGLPVAAVSVAGPAERILARGESLGGLVARTTAEISKRLGYVEASRRAD